MDYLSITDLDLFGRRVLIRVDYNVPVVDGIVTNRQRITETVPTIKYAIDHGASVILISHFGRPDGKIVESMSLKQIAPIVEEELNHPVQFVDDCVGPKVEAICSKMISGEVILLENVRFHPEEETNDKAFGDLLSKLADVYINDAFGTCHRAHSSIVGVNLPYRAAGFLVKKEIDYFAKALDNPKRSFLAIIGGAKVSDKILMINNLLDRVDEMIIAGGMAFTFKKVISKSAIGSSLYDTKGAEIVFDIVNKAINKGVKLHFPIDYVVADKFSKDANTMIVNDTEGIPDGWMGLDIGPRSIKLFNDVIERTGSIVWNGPPGVFEFDKFAVGTRSMLEAVANVTAKGTISIIGGGDTGSCCEKWGLTDKMSHVSTGGGVSLMLLEGKKLPGIETLNRKSKQ